MLAVSTANKADKALTSFSPRINMLHSAAASSTEGTSRRTPSGDGGATTPATLVCRSPQARILGHDGMQVAPGARRTCCERSACTTATGPVARVIALRMGAGSVVGLDQRDECWPRGYCFRARGRIENRSARGCSPGDVGLRCATIVMDRDHTLETGGGQQPVLN
jgi:hypothetical protein